MTTPEQRSDALDRELAMIVAGAKAERWGSRLSVIALLALVGLCAATFYFQWKQNHDTHDIVAAQIPALRQQIKERNRQLAKKDQTIADYEFVLTQQAIPAIARLAKQVQDLGGQPGRIILKPPPHPVKPKP